MLDWSDFEDWLLAEGGPRRNGLSAATAYYTMSRTRRMAREGFPWLLFVAGVAQARGAVRAYLAAHKRRQGSAHARRDAVKVLNRVAAYLGTREAPWEGVEWDLPPEPAAQAQTMTPAQVRAALAYRMPEPRNLRVEARRRAVIWLTKGCANRRGEVAGIEVPHLDPAGCRVWIEHPTKGGDKRWVDLPSDTFSPRRPLAAWLRRRPVDPEHPNALWTAPDRRGAWRRMAPWAVYRDLYEIGKAIGCPVNFTRLRHVDTELLDECNVHPRVIQSRRGHRSIKSTERYMARVSAHRVRAELAAKVPGFGRRVQTERV